MAQIKPLSTSMRLIMSTGQQGGKEITKSVSFSGMDVGADADTLHTVAEALAAVVEHPVVEVRRNDQSVIME